MTTTRRPKAPPDLGTAGAAYWKAVSSAYAVEPHHVALLEQACRALDRAEDARAAILRDGSTYSVKGEPRAHPMITVERDSRRVFGYLSRLLALKDSDSPRLGRPGKAV